MGCGACAALSTALPRAGGEAQCVPVCSLTDYSDVVLLPLLLQL